LGRKLIKSLVLSALLSGCTTVVGTGDNNSAAISEQVAALAAPYQDVSTARILPSDGCYWYLHEGPVEATLLPLRTAAGRPICTARE
jgi:predicted small secreted protein